MSKYSKGQKNQREYMFREKYMHVQHVTDACNLDQFKSVMIQYKLSFTITLCIVWASLKMQVEAILETVGTESVPLKE